MLPTSLINSHSLLYPQEPIYSFLPPQTATQAVFFLRAFILSHCSTKHLNNSWMLFLAITLFNMCLLCMFIFCFRSIEALGEEWSCLPWYVLPSCFNYWEYHSHTVGTVPISIQHVNESINEHTKWDITTVFHWIPLKKNSIIMHIKNLSLNVSTQVSTENKQKDFKWFKMANNNPNPILSRHVQLSWMQNG